MFVQSSKMVTVINEFDVRLANRPFLAFDSPAFWRLGLSAKMPESQTGRNYSVAILGTLS